MEAETLRTVLVWAMVVLLPIAVLLFALLEKDDDS